MRYTILWMYLLLVCSCRYAAGTVTAPETQRPVAKVFILPFGNIDSSYCRYLKGHISSFYKTEVRISGRLPLPLQAFYYSRNRYIADSLLHFLLSRRQEKNEYWLGITNRDISTKKGNIDNWGVMGLGFRPGNACVISTFRIKKELKNQEQQSGRFLKVALHELGHNFGLDHCPNQRCIMVDAEGKNKLDGEENLCKNCLIVLQNKGIL